MANNLDNFRFGSMCRTASSGWRSISEVFYSSCAHDYDDKDDDEEALKWAATYHHVHKGILSGQGDQVTEVDTRHLGSQEKRMLLDNLLKVADEDNKRFLQKLKDRIDSVGIDIPKINVRFEHLKVDAEAYVGGRALPSMLNSPINIIERVLAFLRILPSRKKSFSILKRCLWNHQNEFVPQRTSAYISQHVHTAQMTEKHWIFLPDHLWC